MSTDSVMIQIADSLAMDLSVSNTTWDEKEISGKTTVEIDSHGHLITLNPEIVCSMTFSDQKTRGTVLAFVLVHVGADLFLGLISDRRVGQNILMVIDASRVPIYEDRMNNDDLFPQGVWTRVGLFKILAPGVEAVYLRGYKSDEWSRTGKTNEYLLDYLESREPKPTKAGTQKEASA